MTDEAGRRGVYVSYASRDRPWAEWVAWQLADAGLEVELDVWDWAVGDNDMVRMLQALERAERVVALLSIAYFDPARRTGDEWSSAFVRDDEGRHRLVPVRIEDVSLPALFRPMAVDLFGIDADEARDRLLGAVHETPEREPDLERLPAEHAPRLPGSALPPVWNLPPRNPDFTGRDGMLLKLREQLASVDRVVVQALHGTGGIGKTQIAVEYAHRFAGDYEFAWWINAQQSEVIGDQLTALAVTLGVARPDTSTATAWEALSAELRERGRWLLVFDNADRPEELRPWLPSGIGHVVITSRHSGWHGVATRVEVDVFTRDESVVFLREHLPDLAEGQADRLAEALGDLPLALAQAAGFMAQTGMTYEEYGRELTDTARVLEEGRPLDYPVSLAAATTLAYSRLSAEDRAAGRLLELCAFLAPDPIPLALFTETRTRLPRPLPKVMRKTLARRKLLGVIGRYGLGRVGGESLQVHRLTQATLRNRLGAGQRTAVRRRVEELLAAANPTEPDDPRTWAAWGRLLPHLLAIDPATSTNPTIRSLAADASWYLLCRGDATAGHDLARHLYDH